MTKYTRSVEAALNQTASMFELAEALALDIPKKAGSPSVGQEINEVREAIIAAGGEPRSQKSLERYRHTAFHFSHGVGEVEWAPGFSFTAHSQAYEAGIPAAEFLAKPKTATAIRVENGLDTTFIPAEAIKYWTPKQKREAQDALYQDAVESERQERANRTRATATPAERAKPEPKRGTEAGEAKAAIEGAMAEVMHFSRDTIRRSAAATERFEAAMPNQWWNRVVPGATTYRSHEEQVLGDIDKAIEALSLMRVKVAKVIDRAQATV